MGIISDHLGMLVAMWVVLVSIGLTALIQVVRGIQGKVAVGTLVDDATRPILFDVLPLLVIAYLSHIDPTHIVAFIWYYVAAVLIVVRAVQNLLSEFRTS